MEKLKGIGVIDSKLLNDKYELEFDSKGYFADSPMDDDFPYSMIWYFQKRIYRSSKSIILVDNYDLHQSTICEIDELIKDCFLRDKPKLSISSNLYDAINHLNEDKNYILRIYQQWDDAIRFCLIDDVKLYKKLQISKYDSFNEFIIYSIEKYINDSIFESGYPIHHNEAIIVDGFYRKYKNEKIENGGNNE